MNKKISIDIYRKSKNSILPNPLFHRPLDNLHSRCIEYPLVASKIPAGKIKLLDVGTAKSDDSWILWLSGNRDIKVYAVDYDKPEITIPKNVSFLQSDVRNLPYSDCTFDVITAVSVIEHIGLFKPQVNDPVLPLIDKNGDLDAFKEMLRVLKPGGKLIITFPYGKEEKLILNNEARCYNSKSLLRFGKIAKKVNSECYEYQFEDFAEYCSYPKPYTARVIDRIVGNLTSRQERFYTRGTSVTWRKINPTQIKAENEWHVDGILCTVWEK